MDYMHCVLLGVCRQLLKLWFNSKNSKELWYIGNKIEELDSRLLNIQPPNEMKRTPRSIATTLKYWKGDRFCCKMHECNIIIIAHELRAWLLHYSPVVLYGILPHDYYQHHLLLIEGVYLLLKDTILAVEIKQSSRLLCHYCFMFGALYGKSGCTYVVTIATCT